MKGVNTTVKKLDTSVGILSVLTILLALGTSLAGLLGENLYAGNSISMIAQGRGQDLITAVLAVPASVIILLLARRGSLKARLALAGLLGYYLYTYASYVFAWRFNYLFLAYVAAFSASLFGFILLMTELTKEKSELASARAPLTAGAVILFLFSTVIALNWLSQLVRAMQGIPVPIITDSDARPVIQGLDLGVLVPAAVYIAFQVLRGSRLALVWLPVFLVKVVTLGLAVVSMTVFMARAGTPDLGGAVIFSVLTVFFTAVLIWVFLALRTGRDSD